MYHGLIHVSAKFVNFCSSSHFNAHFSR